MLCIMQKGEEERTISNGSTAVRRALTVPRLIRIFHTRVRVNSPVRKSTLDASTTL